MSAQEELTEQLQVLLEAQRRAQAADPYPDAETRRHRIDRLMAGVLEHAEELAEALNTDFGNRPVATSFELEILSTLDGTNDTRDKLEEWMKPTRLEPVLGGAVSAMIEYQPKGVVGVVGPWNFPIQLVLVPAIEALAAGNRVMIKFSDITPATGEVFARAIASRMSPEEVVVVTGGVDTASAFTSLRFDHIMFTGSPKVGRLVGAAAAQSLVPVTLELGGKNPVIVGPEADIVVAAKRIAEGRMLNNGQVCMCPDYAFVPESAADAFVDAFRESILEHFPTLVGNPDIVTMVNDANYARVVGLIEDAKARGAEEIVIVPDEERAQLPDAATRRIPPTLLRNTATDARINDEEIFGPVLVLHTYSDVDEAIEYVAAHESPLVAYWYGDDTESFQRFLTHTKSGGVARNDTALHYFNYHAPFGGVGMSGSGAYHGRTGFETFSHARTVASTTTDSSVMDAFIAPLSQHRKDQDADAIDTARKLYLSRIR